MTDARDGRYTVGLVEGKPDGRWTNDRGWMIHTICGQMFVFPLDLCAVKPQRGEAIELAYVGDSWKISGIRIGGRVYREQTPPSQ